jgi:hypothetical protein
MTSVLAASVAALALVAVGAAEGRATRATQVHAFAAFSGGKLASSVTVRSRAKGECGSPSGVDPRKYAWRCFSGNGIYDPCFSATASSRTVVCPGAPWSHSVTLLELSKPLRGWKLYPAHPNWPWGIWTTTGKHCYSIGGSAMSSMDGEWVTFACKGGGYLVGRTGSASSIWTIAYTPRVRPGAHGIALARVGITDVWS